MLRHRLAALFAALAFTGAAGALAQNQDSQGNQPAGCSLPAAVVNNVLGQLPSVVQLNNGGLFSPNRMWAAVVDRQGVLCGVTRSDPDAWPGSRDIAIAKAFSANAFSSPHACALHCQSLWADAAGRFALRAEQLKPVQCEFQRAGHR
jgi:hypothetical protein